MGDNDRSSSSNESNAIRNDTIPFYDSGSGEEKKDENLDIVDVDVDNFNGKNINSSDMNRQHCSPYDDDSSSSGSSGGRPQFLRDDSSGSDSDYHRYMRSNFITEVYHTKDYDYNTTDDDSNVSVISSHFSRQTSRSSSFASTFGGECLDGSADGDRNRVRDNSPAAAVAEGKNLDTNDSNTIIVTRDSSSDESFDRRPTRLSTHEAMDHNIRLQHSITTTESETTEEGKGKGVDEYLNALPESPAELRAEEKPSASVAPAFSSSESKKSQQQLHSESSRNVQEAQQLNKPPKPPKPTVTATTSSESEETISEDDNKAIDSSIPTALEELEITVTSPERSLVTSGRGVEQSFYLDGHNKCLISSATSFHPSPSHDLEDMFQPNFIPTPKRNVKSLSWHISVASSNLDNTTKCKSNGYQMSMYKVLLRRSKSWCGGNNWCLFIDGKHVANGKVPLFTMSSEINFEMPSSITTSDLSKNDGSGDDDDDDDGGGGGGGDNGRQTAKIEIKRKAWYRRKLTYKFKIGGNVYPTFYAQPMTLPPPQSAVSTADSSAVNGLDPTASTANSRTDQDTEGEIELSVNPGRDTRDSAKATPVSAATSSSPVAKRSSAPLSHKPLSSTASTLALSHPPSSSHSHIQQHKAKTKSITRIFSPAQMLITIPSTTTVVSSSGKQKIYFQILIRIPALPQPIVVERRYKHFSQLCNLLRGELSLTFQETQASFSGGDGDAKGQSISSACQAKLNQFPTLPTRVYNPMVNQQKPDFIKTRRLALQSFLIELMSYDPKVVHCSEFLGFLGLHPITCTSILKV